MAFVAGNQGGIDQEEEEKKGSSGSFIQPGMSSFQGNRGGSGQFSDTKKYLEANKPKAEALTTELTGGIEEEADVLRDKTKQESLLGPQSQIGQQYQEVTGAKKFIDEQVGKAKAGEEIQQSDLQKYLGFQDPNKVSQPVAKGPDLKQDIQKAQRLDERVGNLKSSEGRFTELRKRFGKSPTYSKGASSLDQMVIPRTEFGKERLKDITKATKDIGQNLKRVDARSRAMRNKILSEKPHIGRYASQQSQAAQDAMLADLQKRAADETAFRQRLASRELLPEDLEILGLTAGDDGQFSTYGYDPLSDVRMRQSPNIQARQMANEQERRALLGLANLRNTEFSNQFDQYEAYNPDRFANAASDIEKRRLEFERELERRQRIHDQFNKSPRPRFERWRIKPARYHHKSGEKISPAVYEDFVAGTYKPPTYSHKGGDRDPGRPGQTRAQYEAGRSRELNRLRNLIEQQKKVRSGNMFKVGEGNIFGD